MDVEEELLNNIQQANVQNIFLTLYKGACLNVGLMWKNEETTPLLQAVKIDNSKLALSISQILLLHGADPDFGVQGRHPLHEAIQLDRLEIVRLLIESGANKNIIDSEGNTAMELAQRLNLDDIENLLLGEEAQVSVKFNGYVFEEMEEERKKVEEENKENIESDMRLSTETPTLTVQKSTDFLSEVEKIFENDILGTPSGTIDRRDISPVKRDIAEVEEILQGVGFKTPISYSSKRRTVLDKSTSKVKKLDKSLPPSENEGYKEKVEKYLKSLEEANQSDVRAKEANESITTPKRPEKSYLRHTVASAKKRRILPTTSEDMKPKSIEKNKKNFDAKNAAARDLEETLRNATLESEKSNGTAMSLAVSLASSNCLAYSEEYIIQDTYCGVNLIEKRIPSLHSLARQDEDLLKRFEDEAELPVDRSTNLSLGSLSDYSLGRIQRELGQYGETPQGPITSATRKAYLIRLKKLKLGLVVPRNLIESRYPGPLADSIRNISSITRSWETLWKLESEMSRQFNHVDPKLAASINFLTRETVCKSSFNYLLLDPRKSQNLPFKVFCWGDQDLWKTFVDSIFYIGKGTRSRPFQHLYDAASKKKITKKHAAKVNRILDIWKHGYGVVSLQVFNNSIAVEGFTREAAMIDALGISNLTNMKPGDYYGPCKDWSKEDQLRLGTFLLYRAFKIFLQEGERQIRPVDLKLVLGDQVVTRVTEDL